MINSHTFLNEFMDFKSLPFVIIASTNKGLCFLYFCSSNEEGKRILSRFYPKSELIECLTPLLRETKEKIIAYFKYKIPITNIPLDFSKFKSSFHKKVLDCLFNSCFLKESSKKTITYSELAFTIGNPKAVRAVASSLKKNPILIIIPCHRVISKSGLGGYVVGVEIKKKLMEIEGIVY